MFFAGMLHTVLVISGLTGQNSVCHTRAKRYRRDDQENIVKGKESCNTLGHNQEISEKHNDEDGERVHVHLVALC